MFGDLEPPGRARLYLGNVQLVRGAIFVWVSSRSPVLVEAVETDFFFD